MHIALNIILFYIHLIFSLAPYMISGVAVYFYFLYKEESKKRNDAIDAYVRQFGGTREEADKIVSRVEYL